MKKNIGIVLILVSSIASVYATSLDENINSLVDVSLNNNVNYLSAVKSLSDSKSELEVDPLIYDSSVSIDSSINSDSTGALSYVSSLDVSVPLLTQLSLNANVDTNLDGGVGLSYNPLAQSDSTVQSEINYENASVYLSEYSDSLKLNIAKAYIDYLLAEQELKQQTSQTNYDLKVYEQEKSLYEYDETTLVDLQDALMSYNESKSTENTLEKAVYSKKVALLELMGISGDISSVEIPNSDLSELKALSENLDTVIADKEFSPMSSYDVVSALNNTIVLEDTYDNLRTYNPDVKVNTSINFDGSFSASLSFTTSASDYNVDEKSDLLEQIDLAKKTSAATIVTVQNEISSLENTLESDKQSISDIQMQIEQNNLVMNEAKSLLDLGEYEQLDYESLQLNENNLNLSLIKAYSTLYVDQLNLVNYL